MFFSVINSMDRKQKSSSLQETMLSLCTETARIADVSTRILIWIYHTQHSHYHLQSLLTQELAEDVCVLSFDSGNSTSGCLDTWTGVQFFLKNLGFRYMRLFQLCNNWDGTSLFVAGTMAPSCHYEGTDWHAQWGMSPSGNRLRYARCEGQTTGSSSSYKFATYYPYVKW